MDHQIGSQGKGIGKCHQAVFEIGRCDFNDIELSDGLTFVIAEKGERRGESGSEGRADFGWIRTDDRQLTVVDLQVLLQLIEAPNLARAFRSPIAAVEAYDQRKTLRQFRQGDRLMPMIRKRQVREPLAYDEIRMHTHLLSRWPWAWPTALRDSPKVAGTAPAGNSAGRQTRCDVGRDWLGVLNHGLRPRYTYTSFPYECFHPC
jgi:hypothetical protein